MQIASGPSLTFGVAAAGLPADDPPSTAPELGLTARQSAVLHLLAQGMTNKQVGRKLGISEGTVKVHLAAVYRALRVHDRVAAVAAAKAWRR